MDDYPWNNDSIQVWQVADRTWRARIPGSNEPNHVFATFAEIEAFALAHAAYSEDRRRQWEQKRPAKTSAEDALSLLSDLGL